VACFVSLAGMEEKRDSRQETRNIERLALEIQDNGISCSIGGGMSDYRRDAYVDKAPYIGPNHEDHVVLIDILEGEEIRHQIISFVFGENNAKGDAANLNKWRDQTRFTQ